jgi:hypothetical protein
MNPVLERLGVPKCLVARLTVAHIGSRYRLDVIGHAGNPVGHVKGVFLQASQVMSEVSGEPVVTMKRGHYLAGQMGQVAPESPDLFQERIRAGHSSDRHVGNTPGTGEGAV